MANWMELEARLSRIWDAAFTAFSACLRPDDAGLLATAAEDAARRVLLTLEYGTLAGVGVCREPC